MKKQERWIDKKLNRILLVILLVSLLGLIASLLYDNANLKSDKQYYQDQMINFCEIAKIQKQALEEYGVFVDVLNKECGYWILSWDNP